MPNGYRTGRLKTAEGLMEYSAPQIAGREEPFRSVIREHLKGHTQGGSGDRDAGTRAVGARHRGCVQGRERTASAVQDRGVAAWGAVVGGLPGVRPSRLERVRDHLSVHRRHCRAAASRRQARAGSGGMGLHGRGPSGAAAHDGRVKGRYRDGDGVLRGHEAAWAQ